MHHPTHLLHTIDWYDNSSSRSREANKDHSFALNNTTDSFVLRFDRSVLFLRRSLLPRIHTSDTSCHLRLFVRRYLFYIKSQQLDWFFARNAFLKKYNRQVSSSRHFIFLFSRYLWLFAVPSVSSHHKRHNDVSSKLYPAGGDGAVFHAACRYPSVKLGSVKARKLSFQRDAHGGTASPVQG